MTTCRREPYIVLQREARRQFLRTILLRFLLAGPPHIAAPAAVGPYHGRLLGQRQRFHAARARGNGHESVAAVLHALHPLHVSRRHRAQYNAPVHGGDGRWHLDDSRNCLAGET